MTFYREIKETDEMIDLYKVFIQQEQWNSKMHMDYAKWFLGINSSILAVTIAGMFKSDIWYEFVILTIGPILIFYLSEFANKTTERFYNRFLEAIISKSKIESKLGLLENSAPKSSAGLSWGNEPLILEKHLKNQNNFKTSSDWYASNKNMGIRPHIVNLFWVVKLVSLVLLISLIYMSLNSYFVCVN